MSEALETSSPATMALAKANGGSTLMSKMATSTLKTTWAATGSLQAMLSLGQKQEEPEQSEEKEDGFAFPSIAWLNDDADARTENPFDTLDSALAIIKEDHVFQRSPMPQAKRRRIVENQGMVRSKAMKNQLSSLASSCSKESTASIPVNTTTKFVLGAWGSVVTARDVTSDLATCSLKSSPFVDTSSVNTGLLTV